MNLSSQLSPNINILVVVPRGVVELHQELDEAECLDVHVVGVDLVPHRLCPAAADTEQHDSLRMRLVKTPSYFTKIRGMRDLNC